MRSVGPRVVADPERSFVRAVRRRDPELVVVPPRHEDPEHDLRPIGRPLSLELPGRSFALEQAAWFASGRLDHLTQDEQDCYASVTVDGQKIFERDWSTRVSQRRRRRGRRAGARWRRWPGRDPRTLNGSADTAGAAPGQGS